MRTRRVLAHPTTNLVAMALSVLALVIEAVR